MEKRTIIIIVSVVAAAVVAAGLGVLIWWLLWDTEISVILLEGDGFGSARSTAAFTRLPNVGDIFWWFYPTTAAAATSQPLLLWLDGVTGVPPSLLANLGMFGPYDFNQNAREDSWIDEFNLLFVDAPVGTGFSVSLNEDGYPTNLDENAEHLYNTLKSFYTIHPEYKDTPLYIVGQGSGAQLALQLAIHLTEEKEIDDDTEDSVRFPDILRGVVLANGVISPTLTLTKLGFYLEEMGYIDYVGRAAIENYSNEMTSLLTGQRFGEAFDRFLSLGDYVNESGETVAVNLGYIVEKLTRAPSTRSSEVPDYFGQRKYLRSLFSQDLYSFMDETVAPALGISQDTKYDSGRQGAAQAVRDTFIIPAVEKVEYILQSTNLTVTIYNGNLDAVSNTPGQLEWVEALRWDGQPEFLSRPRETLVVNRLVEGYFRETSRLQFYWMNAAGHWVPLDSPAAMKRVMQRITGN